MKKINLFSQSGEYCPDTGIWTASVRDEKGNQIMVGEKKFIQGEKFPALNDKPTTWSILLDFE